MRIVTMLMGLFALTFLAACEPGTPNAAEQARRANVAAQQDVMARATAAVPVPRVNNFLTRQNLSQWMKRMDDPAKTWYVYVLGDNGAKLGYYVASTYPQTTCTFMTPPQEVREHRVGGGSGPNPVTVTTAPALDGVYYGAGGACDTYFFFDAASDAMIQITGMKIWTSDVPLNLDVPKIEVAGSIQ